MELGTLSAKDDEKSSAQLGSLSRRYESNGKPGSISTGVGDKGGKSYGMYQLSLDVGTLNDYVTKSIYKAQFTCTVDVHSNGGKCPPYAGIVLGSKAFDTKWKQLAHDHPIEFAADQHQFIERVYYAPIRAYATSIGIPDTNAVNQVLWSTSVQHGQKWTKTIIHLCVGYNEVETIKKIYELRTSQFMNSAYYGSSASRKRVRDGVLNRFKKELKDALELTAA